MGMLATRRAVQPRFAWPLLAVLLSGCSLSPGNRLTLFPEEHRLLDSAKALRNAEPLALPRELNKGLMRPYTVEPGDVVFVQLLDLDSPVRLPGDQPVLADGTIDLGRYGRLVVAGRTVEEIEAAALAAVKAKEKGEVGPINVRLMVRQSKVYYVLGEVRTPGAYPLNGRETVLDAILAAGDLTDRASRRNIILSRPTAPHGCRLVLPICYREIVQLGDTSTNYQIAPGDRIFVPSRTLCEELFHFLPECPPCGRAQLPCPLPVLHHGPEPPGSAEPLTPILLPPRPAPEADDPARKP